MRNSRSLATLDADIEAPGAASLRVTLRSTAGHEEHRAAEEIRSLVAAKMTTGWQLWMGACLALVAVAVIAGGAYVLPALLMAALAGFVASSLAYGNWKIREGREGGLFEWLSQPQEWLPGAYIPADLPAPQITSASVTAPQLAAEAPVAQLTTGKHAPRLAAPSK